MKQGKALVWAGAVAIICILTACFIAGNNIRKDIDRKALEEISASAKLQTAHISHALDLQYASLESLAYYIGTQDNFNISRERELLNAFVRGNGLLTLGYIGLDGNAVNFKGESLGNMSDRGFFREAIVQKGKRSVQYVEKDSFSGEPHVLFGIPVLKGNMLTGVLFAGKEKAIFEDAIFTNGIYASAITVITDSSGYIIALDKDNTEYFSQKNIFEEYTSNDTITANMRANGSGSFHAAHGEYVAYMPVGVNGWYLFSVVNGSEVGARYSFITRTLLLAICLLFAAFAIMLVYLFISGRSYIRKIHKDRELMRHQSERYHTILSEMKSAVYEWNAATQELTTTDAFEKLFGYQLPKNWFHVIPKRKQEHPEFDYKAIMKAKSSVEVTGEKTEVELCVQSKERGLRRIRVTMSPFMDDKKQLFSIYGTISDITQEQTMAENHQFYTAISGTAPMVISVNIEQNRYNVLKHNSDICEITEEQGVFDDLVTKAANIVAEADRQKFTRLLSRDNLSRAFTGGKSKLEFEHRQCTGDGGLQRIWTQVIPSDNPCDDAVLIILVYNIENQSLLQKHYDASVENMPCYAGKLMLTDNDVLLISANRKYLEFMELNAEEAFNKSLLSSVDEEEKNKLIPMLRELESAKKNIDFVCRTCKAGGSHCWFQVQAFFLEEQDGKSVYYGTLTEITDLIETQSKLMNAVEDLKGANTELNFHILRQKALEQKLRISQEEYRIAAELSNCTVLKYDISKRMISILS